LRAIYTQAVERFSIMANFLLFNIKAKNCQFT
jgi:hypothetical protein